MVKTTPCDYGKCPYDAKYAEACVFYCGLGVDEDSYPDEDYEDEEEEYIRSSTNGDYNPSNPFDAPGMNIRDFI